MKKSIFTMAVMMSLTAGIPEAGESSAGQKIATVVRSQKAQPPAEAGEPAAGRKIVTAAQVNGVWETRHGEFRILALGHQELRVEFDGTRDTGTTVNLGEAKGTARIEGTTAVFKPDDTANCTIILEFKGKEMQVSQNGTSHECGFGMGVSADGTYHKTQAGKPIFSK